MNNKTLHPKNTPTCRLPMCAAVVCAEYCVVRDMMHSYMWWLLTRQVAFTCNAKLHEGTYAKFLQPLKWLLVFHIKAPLAQHLRSRGVPCHCKFVSQTRATFSSSSILSLWPAFPREDSQAPLGVSWTFQDLGFSGWRVAPLSNQYAFP